MTQLHARDSLAVAFNDAWLGMAGADLDGLRRLGDEGDWNSEALHEIPRGKEEQLPCRHLKGATVAQ